MPSVPWRCWLCGRKGIRPVKNWVVGCWRGYLSRARCRLANGPADATATHCLLLQWNPDWFYLSGTGSPRKRAVKRVCVCVFLVGWMPVMNAVSKHVVSWPCTRASWLIVCVRMRLTIGLSYLARHISRSRCSAPSQMLCHVAYSQPAIRLLTYCCVSPLSTSPPCYERPHTMLWYSAL